MDGRMSTRFPSWFILLSVAGGAGPAGSPALTAGPGIIELFSASHSGLPKPQRTVIAEESEWAALWQAIHADASPTPPRPDVNLAQRVVIVAALGECSTGGFAIHIDSVRSTNGEREVFVTTTRPGPTCMTTQVLTQPVHVVAAPIVGGSTRFIEAEIAKGCG